MLSSSTQRPDSPMIYEAHIGMAQEHGHLGTYREFADMTLPWISSLASIR